MDQGRNDGATGVVDITGTPQFGVRVLFWKEATTVSSANNTGQGDADLADSLALIENGTVILRGKLRKDLFPFPAVLKNASGTLTFTAFKAIPGGGQQDVKMVATVRFDRVESNVDEKTETMWDVTLGCQRISALTPSGFANNGSQPTTTARTAGNKYLYEGRSKIYDPAAIGPIVDQ